MDTPIGTVLWRQLGAAIDVLDRVLVACPAKQWSERVWTSPPPSELPPEFGEFWQVAHHTLIWLDFYFAAVQYDEFVSLASFPRTDLAGYEALPERRYTKEELRSHLAAIRDRCKSTLAGLTAEDARRTVSYRWMGGLPASFVELQIYNMRHVQEHAAQLSLFLSQRGIPEVNLGWVARATE